jgi:hypothetical protein
MKAFSTLALLALAIAGCSYHKETVVQKPTPTPAVPIRRRLQGLSSYPQIKFRRSSHSAVLSADALGVRSK